MMKHKNLYRFKDFIFRMVRNEGNVYKIIQLRAAVLMIATGTIPILFMLKS